MASGGSKDGPKTPIEQPVTVIVESKGKNRYNIATADLEAIAAQLRGKRTFSVFNSIILPGAVTVLTAFLTTMIGQWFQYISWRNTASLQEATDRTGRAIGAYTKASRAINGRYYATFLLVDTVGDLMNRKTDVDSHLYRLDLKLNEQRFQNYYDQLKYWNENFDEILNEIDFALDRPVGIIEPAKARYVNSFDCEHSVIQQIMLQEAKSPEAGKQLSRKYSLKLQFAAINHCFAGVTATPPKSQTESFNEAKDKAIVDKERVFDDKIGKYTLELNNHVRSLGNSFRCVALVRIEYLKSQQGESILFSQRIRQVAARLGLIERPNDLGAHFRETDARCDVP